MTGAVLTYWRELATPVPVPRFPVGITRRRFDAAAASAAHALLADAYANGFGAVPGFGRWHTSLVADAEYDPELCFYFADGANPVAFALIWTSGFIKDFAVAAAYRRQGIGRTMLSTVFSGLRARGITEVGLKVHAENHAAIALYEACGMRRSG
ncbi:MAG: GNAT family N-acetyltransferase [Alphaproteobacteria bacterium]|nr:GNAT family N-acetyltransferase [Alphaproteobacteria bacterium]